MKRYTSLVVVLLLLVLFVIALNSCERTADDGGFEDLLGELSDQLEETSGVTDNSSTEVPRKFVIIIPSKCGAELLECATFLSDTLSKYVGYTVEVKYDSDIKTQKSVCEILIGETNRGASADYIRKLRSDDYGYSYCDSSVVIAAHTNELCIAAIESFAKEISTSSFDLTKPESIKPFTFIGEYAIDKIYLDGFEICEYDIIYSAKGKDSEAQLAEILRDRIRELGAYELNVIPDSEAKDSTRAICVGKTSLSSQNSPELTPDTAYIHKGNGGHVELLAGDNHGIFTAIDNFCAELFASETDRVCWLTLTQAKSYSYDSSPISFFIVDSPIEKGSLPLYASAVNTIVNERVCLAFFSALSDEAVFEFSQNLGAIEELTDSKSFYFSREVEFEDVTHEVVGNGTICTFILKRSSDQKRFAVVVAQTNDGNSAYGELIDALVDECEELSTLPLIVLADLPPETDELFAARCPTLERIPSVAGAYCIETCLSPISASTVYLDDNVSARLITLKFHYS